MTKQLLAASLLLLAFAASFAGEETEPPKDKAKFHIFILLGQSNMAGSAYPILPEYQVPSQRVLAFGTDMKWRPAQTPLDPKRCKATGIGQPFAKYYAELHPDVVVGLVHCARSGRSLKELAKGGKDRDGTPNYDESLAKIREAAKDGTLKAILWHQGEADCGDVSYAKRLSAFASDLRKDLGEPELPFILGELGRYREKTAKFNEIIAQAPSMIQRASMASAEGLWDIGDDVHFSGFSIETLGARYLMEYLKTQEPALAKTFAPELDSITKRMAQKDAEWTCVLNGSMTDGEGVPVGWDERNVARGKMSAARDAETFASAPASLRIESDNGPIDGSVSQRLKRAVGKTLKISGKAKCEGFNSCLVELVARDSSWKTVFSATVFDAKNASGWTDFSQELSIPQDSGAGAGFIRFSAKGEGKAWLDDVKIEAVERAKP